MRIDLWLEQGKLNCEKNLSYMIQDPFTLRMHYFSYQHWAD